jgi:HK97 family phage prohead protease
MGDKKEKDLIQKELRLAELRAVEIKEPGAEMIVEGYAIIFDKPATHYGFTEIIDRGALDGTDLSDVPFRYNHNDTWLVIARTRNKSLELKVDEKGLFIRATLIDTQTNRDIYKSIQAGLLDKMSFSFTTEKDEWDYEKDTRKVLKIKKLFDVSVVDTPFYEDTEIYARALSELESYKEALESEKQKALEVERLKTEILRKV